MKSSPVGDTLQRSLVEETDPSTTTTASEHVPAEKNHAPGATPLSALYMTVLASAYLWTVMPRTLEALGWTSTAIGLLYSARKLVNSPMMWLWAAAADRVGPTRLIQIQFALGIGFVICIPLLDSPSWLTFVILMMSATIGCSLPLVDALTIHTRGAAGFGSIRAWGTFGFGALAVLTAYYGYTNGDYEQLAAIAPWLLAGLLVIAALITPTLPLVRNHAPEKAPLSKTLGTLTQPGLIALMVLGCLHWVCQAPYNLFLVSFCETRGMPAWTPGAAVAIGVVGEFLVLSKSTWIQERIAPTTLLTLAIVVSALRWWAMGMVHDPIILALLQTTHAVSFGLFLLANITLLAEFIPDELRSTGQAFFYFMIFGLGGVFGSSGAGALKDIRGVEALFDATTIIQLLMIPAVLLFARYQRGSGNSPPRSSAPNGVKGT